MENPTLDAARDRWQSLVIDHQRRRRQALQGGASGEELADLDRECHLLIDEAFSELQTAESLEHLSQQMCPSSAA